MSFFGDLHPSFAGNVVKAVASAKRGYPVVDRALRARPPSPVDANALARSLNEGLRPVVTSVERLTPTAVEVTVRAPLAAAAYRPGQFFRVQNYEANALTENGTTLAMEAVALTGAHVDREAGLISVIALDMGGSTSLVSWLRPGERMVLMGPTGMPSHIRTGRDGAAGRRRRRQRRADDHEPGAERSRLPGALLRRIQAAGGPVLRGRDGGHHRPDRLVLRRGAGVRAVPPPGQGLRRQHRHGHESLCRGGSRQRDRAVGRGPHRGDRQRPDDGRRRPRPGIRS